jgi:hypothetical protein
LGAAATLGGALLNNATTDVVSFVVATNDTFKIFAADLVPPSLFAPGVVFTLLVTYTDASTATQNVTIGSTACVLRLAVALKIASTFSLGACE